MEVRGAERLLFLAGPVGLYSTRTPGSTLDEHIDLVRSNIRTTHIPRRRSA
ncbi:MAG TPA: hypothetical protein VGS60_03685 [Actinomycetes bacterium]|jgi:hypothetical protein|nr:hypothetical protein [Actinomycetes bacterium]